MEYDQQPGEQRQVAKPWRHFIGSVILPGFALLTSLATSEDDANMGSHAMHSHTPRDHMPATSNM